MRHFHVIDERTLARATFSRSENALAAFTHTKHEARLVACEYDACAYEVRVAVLASCVLVCFMRADCDVIAYAFTRVRVRLRCFYTNDYERLSLVYYEHARARRARALAVAHELLG